MWKKLPFDDSSWCDTIPPHYRIKLPKDTYFIFRLAGNAIARQSESILESNRPHATILTGVCVGNGGIGISKLKFDQQCMKYTIM